VSCGMLALHKLGLIHRDLAVAWVIFFLRQARNILVDSSFRCKVADFGHARRVNVSDV